VEGGKVESEVTVKMKEKKGDDSTLSQPDPEFPQLYLRKAKQWKSERMDVTRDRGKKKDSKKKTRGFS